MWTYLVIFFSFALLIGVFVRCTVLYLKGKGERKEVVFKKGDEEEQSTKGENLKKLSRKDREMIAGLFKKGESKLKVGKEDEAIKCFVQALAIDGLHIETQHKLAMLYMQKQMYSAAAALFKNLGELTDEAVHYSHLGLALYQQGMLEEARDAYQKAIEIDPSRPQRFVSLAQVYHSLGQLNNALIAMDKAVKKDTKNLDYLFFLVEVQVELENFVEAKEIVERILQIDSENEEAKKYLKIIG